jgi:GrpB-like predicted nucleotidyltransferase (UPF0157 family)
LSEKLRVAAKADEQGIAAAWEQTNNYLAMYQDSQRELDELHAFVRWIAAHPDIGDSLTAVEREKEFRIRAHALVRPRKP